MHLKMPPAKFLSICSGIIMYLGPANEGRRYTVTPSLIDWAHTQNGPCGVCIAALGPFVV